MAHQETKRCKGCNAPMLSAVEREQGKCTACLRLERTTRTKSSESSDNAHNVELQEVYLPEQQVYLEGQAITRTMTCKVSAATYQNAVDLVERNAQTLSGWLRGLIEHEVYPEQDSR